MATPPPLFSDYPPFLARNSVTLKWLNFGRSYPHPLLNKGGGVPTMHPCYTQQKTALVCTYSLILNCKYANQESAKIKAKKYKSRELLSAKFSCHQKTIKQAGSAY